MSDKKDRNIIANQMKAEEIIEYCRQKFINILPNNAASRVLPQQQKPAPNPQSQLSQLNTIIYKKEEVKQVMRQLSMFLQLVIQNCLLSSDTRVKAQSYRILGSFRNFLSRDLEEFETIIYNRNKSKLPFYEVDCREFMHRQVDLKLPPQVSLYQDPLLFYIYTRFAQEELFINHPIHVNRQERIQILKRHVPFLDPLLIPIISQRLETKSKFSQLEDRLLQIILKSKFDVTEYRQIYFPDRNESQIKNRIKNLSSQNKEMTTNPIKQIKNADYLPLTQSQIQTIFKGYLRFGTRWPVISKYFNCRSAEFLEMEYTSDPKLAKKRQKEMLEKPYESLKSLLDQKMEDLAKRRNHSEAMDLQKSSLEPELIDQQKNQDHEPYNQAQEEDCQSFEEEPQYKIINHLTFQYCQI